MTSGLQYLGFDYTKSINFRVAIFIIDLGLSTKTTSSDKLGMIITINYDLIIVVLSLLLWLTVCMMGLTSKKISYHGGQQSTCQDLEIPKYNM